MSFFFRQPSVYSALGLMLALGLALLPCWLPVRGVPPDTAGIEHLIQQLGSPKFAEREAAAKRLEAIGEPALESLRKATQSQDAETRRRAQAVLDAIGKRVSIIRLTVQPMAAPKPALKYQLLPELKEMNPGNPIHNYLKCFMEQQNFFFSKESQANREQWQTMPLKDLPLNELRGYGGSALRQADYAARLDTPDWQILLKAKSDGYNLLLPEVQQIRMLALALKVRFRAEIAERRFDDAIRTAKTMFALARHMGEHPTLIGNLVGMAIANLYFDPLQEMIEQPGCPNLYWALTDLPGPPVDIRKGMQGERMLADVECAGLDDKAPMSEAQLEKVVSHVADSLQQALGGPEPVKDAKEWLRIHVQDEAHVQAARKRLVEAGLAVERVKEFPALQVALLDEKREFEVRRDEVMKWMALPYWQAEPSFLAVQGGSKNDDLLFAALLRPLVKVRRAQARLEQRIALLRHVEAIRLYAAEHDGKLPKQLGDVKVPLPVDPFTGKPFVYKLEGQTAVIRGSPPKGEEATPAYNVRYEVTIKK